LHHFTHNLLTLLLRNLTTTFPTSFTESTLPADLGLLWRSLFATQAAIQTLQWQWACKDRYVHRTLYKIL